MGIRLHSAKVYDVQYNDCARFNYAQEYINPIINVLAEYSMWCDNDDYPCGASTLEVPKEPFLKNLEYIINPNNEWEYQEELNEAIQSLLKHTDIDKNYLYENLKLISERADTNNDYIHFAWF